MAEIYVRFATTFEVLCGFVTLSADFYEQTVFSRESLLYLHHQMATLYGYFSNFFPGMARKEIGSSGTLLLPTTVHATV